MDILKELWIALEQFVMELTDIAKKTIAVFIVLGYILLFIWSVFATALGWYLKGFEVSAVGFLVLCLCIGILLHISEKYKRSDDIGGEGNQENDTGLRENT